MIAGPTKDVEGLTHMQLDGEPWPQHIPGGDANQPVKVLVPMSTGAAMRHAHICPTYIGHRASK